MALQAGIDVIQGAETFVEGVFKAGGAAGKTFLGDQILIAQLGLEQPGPALVFVEADAAVGGIGRIGAVAVGVGVAKTTMCFFMKNPPFDMKIIFRKSKTFLL